MTIHPVKYLQDHLAQGLRPDGRKFLCFRPVSVNISSISHADSSSIFKIGNTTVVCGIKAEVATPRIEYPEYGCLVPNVELSSLCSPKFRPGPPSDQAQVISKTIETILINSAAVDLKDLCIHKGKLMWVLYCDLICINYDGSIIDACTGALTAALKTLTLPETSYNVETNAISVDPKKRIPLVIKTLPISTSFAIFEDQVLIADPTEEEESLALGKLSIVMDEERICYIHKPGGIPISQHVLKQIFTKSTIRAELIRLMIDTAISSTKDKEAKT